MSNITNRSAGGWCVWLILFAIVYSIIRLLKSNKRKSTMTPCPQSVPGRPAPINNSPVEIDEDYRAIYEQFIRDSNNE